MYLYIFFIGIWSPPENAITIYEKKGKLGKKSIRLSETQLFLLILRLDAQFNDKRFALLLRELTQTTLTCRSQAQMIKLGALQAPTRFLPIVSNPTNLALIVYAFIFMQFVLLVQTQIQLFHPEYKFFLRIK